MIVSGISTFNSRVLLGTTTEGISNADELTVATSGHTGITIRSGTSNQGNIFFSDGTSGADEYRGYLQYEHTANVLIFGTDAVERLRIDSGGRLLLGTTTEGHAAADDFTISNTSADMGLTLRSGTNYQGAIYFSDGTSGDAEYKGIITYNHANDKLSVYTNASAALHIDSSGRLLLGTTTEGHSAADNFTVAESGDCGITIRSGTTNLGSIFFSDATSGGGEYAAFIQYDHNVQKLYIGTGDTGNSDLTINSNGNVGLGLAAPTAASSETTLHIYANEYPEVHLTSSVTGSNAGDGSIFTLNNDSSTIIRNQENSYIRFDTNGSNERFRIESAGDALFTTNQVKLYNNFDTSNTYFYAQNTGGGNAGIKLRNQDGEWTIIANDRLRFIDDDASVERLSITSGGLVGINETSPQNVLQVKNTTGSIHPLLARMTGNVPTYAAIIADNDASTGTRMFISLRINNSEKGSINSSNGTNTTYATSSDYRLKENISDITDGIERLKQLKPRKFNWIDSDNKRMEDGFIAHEVSPLIPEAVVNEKDGEIDENGNGYQQMDYGKVTPLLAAALKEAIAKIETLETKVDELESKLNQTK